MNFNEYQLQSRRTRPTEQMHEESVVNAALGVADEAGEVAGVAKKHIFHGHTDNAEKMKEELGDVLWYVAWMADLYGYSLSEVAQGNIDKLRRRYPDGFDAERSRNRVTTVTEVTA